MVSLPINQTSRTKQTIEHAEYNRRHVTNQDTAVLDYAQKPGGFMDPSHKRNAV